MRTFLQRSAGGTFCMGTNITFIPRKYSVEIVIKLQGNLYAVVTVVSSGQDELIFFCNWGTFFDRLYKAPSPDIVLGGLQKKCPKFVDLAVGKSPYDLIRLPQRDGCAGIGKIVKVKYEDDFVCTVVKPKHIKVSYDLVNYNVSIYDEILKDCPIEEWKKGLDEVHG